MQGADKAHNPKERETEPYLPTYLPTLPPRQTGQTDLGYGVRMRARDRSEGGARWGDYEREDKR